MSGELLPCPFCGGSAAYDLAPPHGAAISCNQCDTIVVESDEQRVRLLWNTRMTTQQDSVDVERAIGFMRHNGLCAIIGGYGYCSCGRDEAEEKLRALSLPITQRDEQGSKTYADGVEDAAEIARVIEAWRNAKRLGLRGLNFGMWKPAAIRRLSIEQGDQDGGETLTDDERLIRSVIRGLLRPPANARSRRRPLWSAVMATFALGSTKAWELCTKHGFDPDREVKA